MTNEQYEDLGHFSALPVEAEITPYTAVNNGVGTTPATGGGVPDEDKPESPDDTSYTKNLIAKAEENENRGRRGVYHPAQVLLDQIDIASSFPDPGSGLRIRQLIKQVRNLL